MFNVVKIDLTRRQLMKTNLFQNVEIERNYGSYVTGDSLDLTLVLYERKSNFVGVSGSVAYGTTEFFDNENQFISNVTTEVGKRNIWSGSGADIRLELNLEFLYRDKFRLSKLNPKLELSKINLPFHRARSTFELGYFDYVDPDQSNDNLNLINLGVTSEYDFSEREKVLLSFKWERIGDNVTNPRRRVILGLSTDVTDSTNNNVQVISIQSRYSLDKRNHFVAPSSGYLTGFSAKYSRLISESQTPEYLTLQAEYRRYFELKKNKKLIFAWKINGVGIFGKDPINIIPKTERLFSSQLMRGFNNDLGVVVSEDTVVTDSYYPYGDKFFFVSNFELRYRLNFISEDLYSQAFVDVGNLWSKIENITIPSLRYTAGIGFSWNFNILIARVEYAIKLNRRRLRMLGLAEGIVAPLEDRSAFHFGFSYQF